jgi:hypothetical protein
MFKVCYLDQTAKICTLLSLSLLSYRQGFYSTTISMNQTFIITTSISIILALFGYLFTWFSSRRSTQQQAQLDRVNQQLSNLYGPLFALVESTDISWRAFRSKHQPNSRFFSKITPPNEEDVVTWRLWMQTVFMPINSQMYDIIQDHAHLLIESDMPKCLLLLLAHVASFKAVIQQWEQGDFSEHESMVAYPSESLVAYVNESYKKLKAEQAQLIGLLKR